MITRDLNNQPAIVCDKCGGFQTLEEIRHNAGDWQKDEDGGDVCPLCCKEEN